jgi:hypothetical protein
MNGERVDVVAVLEKVVGSHVFATPAEWAEAHRARAVVDELIAFKDRIDAAVADLPWKDDCAGPGLYDIRDRTGASYRAVRAERHPSSGNLQCMGMNVANMRTCGLGYQWRRIPDTALARIGATHER